MPSMYTCLKKLNGYKNGRLLSLIVTIGLFIAACASGPSRPFAPLDPSNSSSVEVLTVPPEFRTATSPSPNSAIVGQIGQTGVINDSNSEMSFESAASQDNMPENISEAPQMERIEPSAAPLGNISQMDVNERLANLEKHYQAFYNDFYAIYPHLKSLAAIEKDMQELVTELSYLADKDKDTPEVEPMEPYTETHVKPDGQQIVRTISPDPMEMGMKAEQRPIDITTAMQSDSNNDITQTEPPKTAEVITVKPEEDKPVKAAPITVTTTSVHESKASGEPEQAVQSGTFLSAVQRVRIGEHPGKKRIVVDFVPGSIIDYSKAQDNGTLTISLGDTMWKGRTSWTSSNSNNAIKGYTVSKTATGSVLTINLNSQGTVQKIFDLPPESASIGPKLIIDITG